MARRAFSLGIAAYAVAWIGALVFASRVFGMGGAIGLSLILVLPFIVAVRMRLRWPAVRGREFAFLLVLFVFVSGGSVFTVWDWYDVGMHHQHARDVKFDELAHEAHAVPSYKGRYMIRGTVASQADLERFLALCVQYDFRFYAKDVVAVSGNQRKSE